MRCTRRLAPVFHWTSLLVCLTLVSSSILGRLPLGNVSAANTFRASQAPQSNGKARKVKALPPRKGPAPMTLPNLDEVKRQPPRQPQAPPPIPSSVRTKHKQLRSGSGQSSAPQPSTRDVSLNVRAHHARTIAAPPAPLPQSGPSYAERAMARLDPFNQTGNQLLARDCEWSLPLLNLPGRAGLDLGLTLSYSSMVWTRAGNSIYFDEDSGTPSPGFRLGFPTVGNVFVDPQANVNALLLTTSSGRRVELRQVSTGVYEAADSSYLQLIDNGNNTLTLKATDGTQIFFGHYSSGWQATRVKDRNGNYISIVNDQDTGDIQAITDTLGREIDFNYDSYSNLNSISERWDNRTINLATFVWGDPLTISPSSFSGLTVVGVPTDNQVPVLRQVGLPDGSYYGFEYNGVGQVNLVHRFYYNGIEQSHVAYDYNNATDDCPRIQAEREWIYDWSDTYDLPHEVVTSYAVDSDGGHRMTLPDGTVYKEFYGAGWQKGLGITAKSYATVAAANSDSDSSPTWKKKTTTDYEQDNTSVAYQTNPRVIETNVYDASGNRRRTQMGYFSSYGLLRNVTEFQADATSVLRRTYFDYVNYVNDSDHSSPRIIGLPALRAVFDGAWNEYAKTEYYYDWSGEYRDDLPATPIQHDAAYNTGFALRGNLVRVMQWDAADAGNWGKVHENRYGYNIAGGVIFTRDPLSAQTNISYSDSFSDGLNYNTYAYPTTITDADGYSSHIQYNFGTGLKTTTRTPLPNTQANQLGPTTAYEYDDAQRLTRVSNNVNNAYTRYVYGTNWSYSYASVNNVADEAYSFQIFDGAGRVIEAGTNRPGQDGYYAQETGYDLMGRVSRQSNPTEITSSWVPTGDDASGWIFSNPIEYDWKGRPLRTYNQDGTYKTASYDGCGCAGGEVVTLTDEVGRQQKAYSDVLGRQVKTEIMNGTSIYSTTTNTFNALDQVTNVRITDSATGNYQDTTMTYDGYGRLQTKHVPEQDAGTNTVYEYNPDDTVSSVKDARNATSTYGYNNRHEVTSVTHTLSGQPTISLTYGYDAAGNRTSMTDGQGSTSYSYDQLSRLTSETRTFTGVGSFMLNYDYNLAGELKKITDATNMTINYGYDSSGRVNGVTGSDSLYAGVSNYASNFQYRAWGGLKSMTEGTNHVSSLSYNSKLQPSQFDISGSVVHQNYDYYDDGRISFVHNTTDASFDRAYFYDHAARLIEAKSGGYARGDYGQTPYHETFGYDAFSSLTARESDSWDSQITLTDPATYSNNRRDGWGYDADGRNTTIDTRTNTFDASGRQASMTAQKVLFNGNHVTVTENSGYDGDGARVYDAASGVATYYLRSSVLGGAITEELNSSGQKNVGYVYSPSGTELARQSFGTVSWKLNTPAGTSQYELTNSISAIGRTEFDPLGANISLSAPEAPPPPEGKGDIGTGHFAGIMDSRFSDFFNISGGCTIDGMASSCGTAMAAVNAGAAVEGVRGAIYNLTTHSFDHIGELYVDPILGYAGFDAMNTGALGTVGHGGHTPDTYSVNLAGVNDSSVTIFAGRDSVSTGNTQNTQPREKLLREPFARTANLLENLDPTSDCGKLLGPHALEALNSLATIIGISGEPQTNIAIKQEYPTTQLVYGSGNVPIYRVPTTARVYSDGSFFPGSGRPGIGTKPAGSAEAQILALLHEIAHNIVKDAKGPKVKYIFEDDGNDGDKSKAYTKMIEDACGKEISRAAKVKRP